MVRFRGVTYEDGTAKAERAQKGWPTVFEWYIPEKEQQ